MTDPTIWCSRAPGGSNGIPRGARTPPSTHNLRRVYQAAVAAAGKDLLHLDLQAHDPCRRGWSR